jgi:PPOX class probable F420-dependent enzyme
MIRRAQRAQPTPRHQQGARRMGLGARIEKALDGVYLRFRHPAAFTVTSGEPGDFSSLRDHKYALIVTFRRSGKAVPTVTWFGIDDDGNGYAHAFADAGKVKRLRNNPRILLAPCTVRGKPLGAAIEGRGRILPPEQWDHAERAIAANYGLGRWLYLIPSRREPEAGTYLEIVAMSR